MSVQPKKQSYCDLQVSSFNDSLVCKMLSQAYYLQRTGVYYLESNRDHELQSQALIKDVIYLGLRYQLPESLQCICLHKYTSHLDSCKLCGSHSSLPIQNKAHLYQDHRQQNIHHLKKSRFYSQLCQLKYNRMPYGAIKSSKQFSFKDQIK